MPPLKTGLKGRMRGRLFYPFFCPCTLLTPSKPLPAAPRIPDPQDHLRHPGMAKVEMIHFGLQTFNSPPSPPIFPPRSQRRCYLNDLGNECVHQRQKDIVCCLCACVALWNIFFFNLFSDKLLSWKRVSLFRSERFFL